MATGTLEITIISASFSPYASFDSEPNDTYAILRCNKEQRCTKTAEDHGRLPVWNETLEFNLEQEDMSKELVVQVFGVNNEKEELLGVAKIPILSMVGKEEATLSALINPQKGETGKLKAAWKWKPDTQKPLRASNNEGKVSEVYEYSVSDSYVAPKNDFSKLEAVSDSLKKMSLEKESSLKYSSALHIPDSAAPHVVESSKYSHGSGGTGFAYPQNAPDNTPSYPPLKDAYDAPLATEHKLDPPPRYTLNQETYPSYQNLTVELGSHVNEANYQPYPPAVSTTLPTYSPSKESYPPYGYETSGSYPPAAYPPPAYTQPHTQLYPPQSQGVSSAYPPSYPPTTQDDVNYPQSYPPNLDGAYPPAYPPAYPSPTGVTYPTSSYPPPSEKLSGYPVESLSYSRGLDKDKDKGKGKEHKDKDKKDKDKKDKDKKDKDKKDKDKDKDKNKKDKDKHKTDGSHALFGQPPYYAPPPQGYGPPAQGYPPPPQGYPPPPQGYSPPPQGYPPPSQGYPPPPQGYPPPAPGYSQGYPPAPGYPPASQGYPPAPQGYHPDPYNVGSFYPPTAHPPHDQLHYPTQHGSSSYGKKH